MQRPRIIEPLSKHVIASAHESFVAKRRAKRLACIIAKLIPKECETGLDIGCGSGAVAILTQKILPTIKLQGVDTLARANALMEVSVYDGVKLPFPDKSVDFSMLIDVLHHTTDQLAVLQEAVRVSRRYVLIKDHCCENKQDFAILSFLDWVGNKGHGVALPYNYQSRSQWNKMFEDCNLKQDFCQTNLELYPWPFSLFFERHLHFATLLSLKK